MRRIAIAAGGTGGHISPGVALWEEIQRTKSQLGIEDVFLHCPLRNRDNPDLQNPECKIIWHNLPQFRWKSSFLFPWQFLAQWVKTILAFRKHRINTVIGMGGYTSILSLLYARVFGYEFFLCEQNCMPGKITRYFWKSATRLALSYPLRDAPPLGVQSRVLGNPVRSSVIPRDKIPSDATNSDGVSAEDTGGQGKAPPANSWKVLVLGGSQGARQINTMVLGAVKNEKISERFQFRVLTGTNLYDEFREFPSSITAIAYSQDMASHYSWADLVVARSGAGVLAECTIYGLPMVLVPYPYAMDNHQKENALYFSRKKACILLDTRESNPEPLTAALLKLYDNPDEYIKLSQASSGLGRKNASRETLQYFFAEATTGENLNG